MRLLVVEDDQRKLGKLVRYLVGECGLDEHRDVVTAGSVFEAKRLLREEAFDLLLLDIVLPIRAGSEPSQDASVALVRELTERKSLVQPKFIVGITAFEEVARDVAPLFEERLWTVIQYDQSSDEWLGRIKGCIAYLNTSLAQSVHADYVEDLCIVTALPNPEASALHRLNWDWGLAEPLDEMHFARRGQFTSDGISRSVISVSAPRMGMVATALTAARVVDRFRPKMLAMVGICAGVRGKVNLGDVIMADASWDYQSGKRIKDGNLNRLLLDLNSIPVPEQIRSHGEQLRADASFWGAIRGAWIDPPDHALKMSIGAIASGSAVVADGIVIPELTDTQQRKLLGIDMEVYGLYAAASLSLRPRPVHVAIKSVCDFGDSSKEDSAQAYASYTSVCALKELVERYFDRMI